MPARFAELSPETIRALRWCYGEGCEHGGKISQILTITQQKDSFGRLVGKPEHKVIGYRCTECDAYVYFRD